MIFELNDEDNIALLSDAVGLDISVNESESSVGDFSVEILNQGWYEKNGKRIHQWRWKHLSEPLPF